MITVLNAGILIMDLEKMRKFGWISLMIKLFQKYHKILPNADQDLIRLAILFYPGKVQPLILLEALRHTRLRLV